MRKSNQGQCLLILAVALIAVSGASVWFGWFDRSVSQAAFIIALIFIGGGTYLSKHNDMK